MKRALLGWIFFPVILFGQSGVHFETGLNWEQVKAKAKQEHKFIFVDCFASWCAPCKEMDKTVYPKDSVGDFINPYFVSVKVQCDTSKNDSGEIQAWHADAHQIVSAYQISAYPTFLFISPDGILVHKGLGYHQPAAFLALAQEALDSHKQFYTLLRNYKPGQKDYAVMPYLAATAQGLREKELSQSIADDYIQNYLDKLPDAAFFTRENFTFIVSYPANLDSKERLFDWCFHRPGAVDTLMHEKGFSNRIITYVINNEEITPLLRKAKNNNGTPDWEAISAAVKHKFGNEYVEGNILGAKVRWYHQAKDWKNYIQFLVAKMDYDHIEQNAPKDFWGLYSINVNAWDIFQHSEDKAQLQKALDWSNMVLAKMEPKSGPNYGACIDTKANLLYKLGKKEEALALEAKASELTPDDKEIQEAYHKMQEGKPTW